MKIKPYRICDVCENEYYKVKSCAKVKIMHDPTGFNDKNYFKNIDICPDCTTNMIKYLKEKQLRQEEGEQ